MTQTEGLSTVFRRLERWGAERGWIGPDPYEGLNTPIARLAPGIKGRQAVVQAYKRAPFSPPWPLSTPPLANAKALGLVLSGYCTPAGAQLCDREARARLVERLSQMRIRTRRGWGWSYHFDVQTRHLFYGRSTPNAVATTFVVTGLLDAYERSGEDAYAELALASRPFLLSLADRPQGSDTYFAYVAGGSRLIHNANLLVCATLARLHDLLPDDAAAALAIDAAETTIRAQRDDGLWTYGSGEDLTWADNFHTAYILESLAHTDRTFSIGEDALRTGLPVWRQRFFDSALSARYHPDAPYPLETHSFASAIDLCCTARSFGPDLTDMARRVASRAIELLWIPEEGRFAFRVSRWGLNRREFVRWTNAPMFRALGRLLAQISIPEPQCTSSAAGVQPPRP